MSIFGNTNNVDPTNVSHNYKKIAIDFCKHYYTIFDQDFSKLSDLYKPESKFTFLEEEFIGYNKLFNKLVNGYNMQRFHHNVKTMDAQPVGNSTLLITATGNIGVNGLQNTNTFVETFLLQKDQNKKFYVYNTIFRVGI